VQRQALHPELPTATFGGTASGSNNGFGAQRRHSTLMFKAIILVRNFESNVGSLDFGEFTIRHIDQSYEDLRQKFSSIDVNESDWLLEKSYAKLPLGPPGSAGVGIQNDAEDLLLLLRLFKPGDLAFVKLAIIVPSGVPHVQFPYRAMNDLNSYSSSGYKLEPGKCEEWRAFASQIRESQSWKSDWFATARRFFLSGGAKQFNPEWDDLDRIVDYATALEATLVPEKDYSTRRLRYRAGALLAEGDASEMALISSFTKKLYEIRSSIVHGSKLGNETRKWLLKNWEQIEIRMRQILVSAVKQLPPGDEDRRRVLSSLYDPTDEDRSDFVMEKFKEIKSTSVRGITVTNLAEWTTRRNREK
jgi:hypothetical protein